jgi:hypothetical protein
VKTLRDMTEPELKELMDAMGKQIVAVAAVLEVEKPHFALLLFNDPEIAQYVCNCERSDVIKAFREAADRLEGRETLDRVEFPPGLGATGEYPDGKFNAKDEGELNFAVGSDRKTGKVMMTFGKPVAWIGMRPKEALDMSDALRYHASKVRN